MQAVQQIYVVGGAKDFVLNGPAVTHFKKHGISILLHSPGADGSNQDIPTQLPAGCDGVVIFRDMSGHGAYHAARDLADKAGIPCAAVPRKWCKAEPILRMQGILPPLKNDVSQRPTHSKVIGVAAAFITEERERGRAPALDETRAALKMAFGTSTPFSAEDFNETLSKVSAPAPVKVPQDDLRSAVVMVLEDNAELHQHPEQLREAVAGVLNEIPSTLQLSQVVHLATTLIQEWRTNIKSRPYQAERHRASVSWLKRVWQEYADGGDWPVDTVLAPRFRAVFGWTLNNAWNREARMAVLGEWAYLLLNYRGAEKRYQKGGGVGDFQMLWESPVLKTINAGRWELTSAALVDALLQAETPAEPIPSKLPTPEVAPLPVAEAPQVTTEVIPLGDAGVEVIDQPSLVDQLMTRLDALEANLTNPQLPGIKELLAQGGKITITIKVNPRT